MSDHNTKSTAAPVAAEYQLAVARTAHYLCEAGLWPRALTPMSPTQKAKKLARARLSGAAAFQAEIPTGGEGLGVVTGFEEDCLITIDEDSPGALAELEKTLGALPQTIGCLTGRDGGGQQLWFRAPADRIPKSSRGSDGGLAPGVDVRGQGGLAAVPPTQHHSGRRYQWTYAGETFDPIELGLAPGDFAALIADLPETWLARMKQAKPARPESDPADAGDATGAVDADDHETTETTPGHIKRMWAAKLAALASTTEGRNDAINGAAYWAARRAQYLPADAKERLLTAARRNGYVAQDGESAALASIESGWRSGVVKPLQCVEPSPAAVVPANPAQTLESVLATNSQPELLAWLNSNHTVLTQVGGKCRVVSWSTSDRGWRVPVLQEFEDFKKRYLHRHLFKRNTQGEVERIGVAPWWLSHPERAEALGFAFRPDRSETFVDGYLNLWTGYGVAPQAGSWSKMQAFIRDVVASGVAEHESYIRRWMAWVVQNPGERAETVLVLRGAKGTGKNTLLDALCKLFGHHARMVSQPKHLTGNFNAHLQDCSLLFANEAIPPNDKAAESVLKTLVTDDSLAIERKGVDVEFHRNALSICMASNESWCVPAGFDERRFAVFSVSDVHRQDFAYFSALRAELNAGGYAAMLHDLLATDLNGWHPREGVPRTAALTDQVLTGLRGADRIVYQMLASGELLGRVADVINPVEGQFFVSTRLLTAAAKQDQTQMTAIGRSLAKCCLPGTKSCEASAGGSKYRGFWVPSLEQARATWAAVHGLDVEWGPAEGWVWSATGAERTY